MRSTIRICTRVAKLEHFLQPMIHKIDSLFEDWIVKTRGFVAGLIVIHSDAGSEHHSRNAMVNEHSLIGESVEHVREILTAVIAMCNLQV